MRVGVIVRMEADTDINEKFAEVRAMGMESCQLVCWERKIINDEKAAEAILAAAEKHGITISAFWCGWGGRKVWDFYDGQLTLGLVPADYRAERCKKNGQVFLFETGQETPVTLKRALQDIEKDVGEGCVGVNLDPANLLMYGKANPVDALEVFGEYVCGVHGKDGKYPTDGHLLGEEVPIGQGKVNYPVFVERLKEVGYDGDITIEREISGEEQKKDILAGKEYLEQLIG